MSQSQIVLIDPSKVNPDLCLLLLKDHSVILFAITAAGFVPCGGPNKSPSIVQIIF